MVCRTLQQRVSVSDVCNKNLLRKERTLEDPFCYEWRLSVWLQQWFIPTLLNIELFFKGSSVCPTPEIVEPYSWRSGLPTLHLSKNFRPETKKKSRFTKSIDIALRLSNEKKQNKKKNRVPQGFFGKLRLRSLSKVVLNLEAVNNRGFVNWLGGKWFFKDSSDSYIE